ncbi:hypothetical protein [Nitrosospira lacus]|uniref:hypothetical protein n=1 Tax=Nitrosospira lacus TaxID=1288494 RepID=UPI0002C52D1C|nr:hypothetical protein [Nitrosospira lacus]
MWFLERGAKRGEQRAMCCKTVQSAMWRTHQKGEDKVMQKVIVDHLPKIKK